MRSTSPLVQAVVKYFAVPRAPATRAEIEAVIINSGFIPKGKHFGTTLAKALKRLVKQGFLAAPRKNVRGHLIYEKKKL